MFSAALCRGLIEALGQPVLQLLDPLRFPRLYAAASLKRDDGLSIRRIAKGFPRLYAAASLKREIGGDTCRHDVRFPRLYAAASLKPTGTGFTPPRGQARFPRLYAAASLKLGVGYVATAILDAFSAALCRGLIEAATGRRRRRGRGRFSAALCRGLIEAFARDVAGSPGRRVFRGFMPRPH